MTIELVAMAAVFVVLMVIRVPVAFAIMGAVATYFLATPGPDAIFPQRMVASLGSFPVLAVPFFVLAGTAMARGGMAMRLIGLADALVGHVRGGLGQVNVLNSLFIGGMSGSAKADSAIDARILVPVMVKHGYSLGFSSALTAASSIISPLLPPSIALILYGLLAGVSIGQLFIAGIIPAIIVAIALMILVRVKAGRHNYGAVRLQRMPIRQVLVKVRESWLALLMPVGIIAGLRLGVFTPTELGAVIAVYALVVGLFVYKEIKWRDLGKLFTEAALLSAGILVIIAAAGALGYVLTFERIPQQLALSLTSVIDEPWIALIVINVALLLLGMVMESTSLLIIVTPVLAPVVITMGIDPVQFGVVLALNMVIGGITPPIGGNMFTVCAITGCSIAEFTKEIMVFIAVLVGILAAVSFIPALTLALPAILLP